MAAKLLHSLADENPDLQKQIGCMTGIFQLFDRHQALTGPRLTQKRLPPATSHFHNGVSEGEFNNLYHRQAANEMNLNRNVNEKQRLSTESSRASFSSSCSSLSSLEGNKTAQQEASSFDRITFPEMPSRDPVINQGSISPRLGQHSLDLRDVVKDSMYREARGLSVRTTSKEEAPRRSLRHKDSPRPLQLSKKSEQDIPNDFRESVSVLSKLREAPWNYNEDREAKDGPWHPVSKDGPRYSYDGRERNRLSLDSRDSNFKSAPRLKELPRFSLDGREGSVRGSNSDLKQMYHFKNFQDERNNQRSGATDLAQPLDTQNRPPSVVAKLMGLDALPDSLSSSKSRLTSMKTCPIEDKDPFLRPLKSIDRNKPIRVPNSLRSSLKDPASPQWKNPDLIMRPLSSSKFPIEPAPWKHPDGSRASLRTGFKPVKAPVRTQESFPSVYSEIEKRLNDLEFKHSGKDLRALKQILEAMQSKGILESRKEEEASVFEMQRVYGPNSSAHNQKLRNQRNPQTSNVNASTNRRSNSVRGYDSPIVIIKPAKLVQKSETPNSNMIPLDNLSSLQNLRNKRLEESKRSLTNSRVAKDRSPKSSHIDSGVSSSDKKTNSSSNIRTKQPAKESAIKGTGSVSPRLQQKKLEMDKRSRPPTPPSDQNKTRRQLNRELSDLGSRGGGKLKQKSQKSTQFDDQSSQISNESRTSSYHGDDSPVQSDTEFNINEQVLEIDGSQSPSLKAANHAVSDTEQKKSTPTLNEDGLVADFVNITPEHPSPVSVLDAPVLRDDDPSPVKQTPTALEGNIAQNSGDNQSEYQWNADDNIFLVNNTSSGITSEMNRKKLQNINHLVQKLRRLNSSHDEASTDYIASLCENTNPDHRYISEILLASGLLLKDLGSSLTAFQFHPSGHPINPQLFFVLEQTNATNAINTKEEFLPLKVSHPKSDPEKFHRKLIFDTVNEILIGKLASVGTSQEPWLKTDKLTRKTLSAQELLKELCSEVEQLQAKKRECSLEEEGDDLKSILWEDVMHRSDSWTSYHGEISGLVLDVERLVFKDLVNEVVIGEAANLRSKKGRRRQLFSS